MSAPLFTNVADPVERLPRTHEALSDMKERHRGNLDVGIVADRDKMPDVQRLIEWLRDGVAELLALSSPAAALSQITGSDGGNPQRTRANRRGRRGRVAPVEVQGCPASAR